MIELVPLCTARVEVAPTMSVGTGPAGDRSVGELKSVTVTGERMNATLAGAAAADWLSRTGTVAVIDVRMTLRTDDGALVYMTYGGRLDLGNYANGLYAMVAPTFETGDERYAWLNKIQAVGKGKLTPAADGSSLIEYEFYEVR